MPFIQRFSKIGKGAIVFTGNTLGLSKKSDSNDAGVDGSIGAFISLDQTLQVPTYPLGTTLNYLQNGSSAVLNLPPESTILYAELVWGGLYKSTENNISGIIDNNIIFKTPDGENVVAPDIATKQNFIIDIQNGTVGFYLRSANVTNLISAESATYSVKQVPALIEAMDSYTADTNHAGWTLGIVYENFNEITRSLNLWVGGEPVIPFDSETDIPISGFLTPTTEPVKGKLFISVQEGDAVIINDKMLFGETTSSLTQLVGVNNPENNFFCSQINNSAGELDTSGTFGNRNANPVTGQNIVGGRQGWDITAINISDILSANQNQALIRFATEGDLYLPNMVAIQIESLAADIEIEKSNDKDIAEIGEEIEYTITAKNNGEIIANNVLLYDILPDSLTLVSGSITVDGATYPDTIPVDLENIEPHQIKTIKYKAIANDIPTQNPAINIASATFSFEPFEGTIIDSSSNTDDAEVFIYKKDTELIKSQDKTYVQTGNTLQYKSVFTNNSNLEIKNIFFKDILPSQTEFIEGTVIIDNVSYPSYNPETGFALQNLLPGENTVIEFQVKII